MASSFALSSFKPIVTDVHGTLFFFPLLGGHLMLLFTQDIPPKIYVVTEEDLMNLNVKAIAASAVRSVRHNIRLFGILD